MASLIPGYEYDIFISYRQKDNKYDGWVTEFVDHLKKELEATFKEQVSVYFDINPSDYLQESYDVDASLKDKLKCLVFIPIISRTYCDSKSFAWVHEFKAFIEQASKDQYGLKIKLPNGNVASRVLPVRIHDLDSADIQECESMLGGVLRGIEFIYREAGIDKPLAPDDDEKRNLNKTKYRIQIIKVAHSIKEIILGMKNEPTQILSEKEQNKESVKEVKTERKKETGKIPVKVSRIKFVIPAVIVLALLIIAGIIAYPKIFKRNTIEKLRESGERISVAVMPFQNMTNDTLTWNVYQEIIQSSLSFFLSNFPQDLQVRQTESINNLLNSEGRVNYGSITPSFAQKISKTLNADLFIQGNIVKSGDIIRLSALLIDTKTEEIIKPFQIEGPSNEENLLPKVDSLSGMIKDFLVVSKLEKDLGKGTDTKSWAEFSKLSSTNSPDAFKYYINAINAYSVSDLNGAVKWISKSVSLDSAFFVASSFLITGYVFQGKYDSAKMLCHKLYKKRDQMPPQLQISMDWMNAWLNETPGEEIRYLRQLQKFDDQDPALIRNMGDKYFELNNYEEAIPEYEKALSIYKKWGTKPQVDWNYYRLGISYHNKGRYKKEKELYEKAVLDFPYSRSIIRRQAILELTEGDEVAANEFIEEYLSTFNKNSSTFELSKAANLASIYSEAGMLDKAEDYYRQALSLKRDTSRLNSLSYFLIDKERNINQGLELIDEVLKISPDNYSYLHTQGWGLYKQGKYQEALEILQKSWDLRKKNSIYDHNAWLHLEAARKAVKGVK